MIGLTDIALVVTDINGAVGVSDLAVICGTGAAVSREMREAGMRSVALDEVAGELPDVRSGERVLAEPEIQQQMLQWGTKAVVPFKSSARLERLCSELDIAVLAPAAQAGRRIENKLQLARLAGEAGVEIPRTWNASVHESGLRLDDGVEPAFPAVLQPSVGFAGQGTVYVTNRDEADAAARDAARRGRDGDLAKLTEYVHGVPLTLNGVVFDDGTVIAGGVARQLTGIAELTDNRLAGCGNDWDPGLDAETIAAARAALDKVGRAAHAWGLRGVFGIDLIATSSGAVVLIEVNPRWTAGLAFTLALQAHGGGPTLLEAMPLAFPTILDASSRAVAAARERFAIDAPAEQVQPSIAAASLLLMSFADRQVTTAEIETTPLDRELLRGAGVGRDGVYVIPRPASAPVRPSTALARVLIVGETAADPSGRALRPPVAELAHRAHQDLVQTSA